MIVLDTNVISEVMHPRGVPGVRQWVEARQERLAVSVLTMQEVTYGAHRVADPERRERILGALETLFSRLSVPLLPVDASVASRAGSLMAQQANEGRVMSLADGLIAATALVHGISLATRNTKDFEGLGVTLVNPWDAHSA